MKKEWLVKTPALGIIVLFIVITFTPTIVISNYSDDTIPPVTTISFNPSEPDGENGWFVSNVTITLNAIDDFSGVNITRYRVDAGIWYNYTVPFILAKDGQDILIDFYSIDFAGNYEEVKSAIIDIDKTKPSVSLTYEVIGGNYFKGWNFQFTATTEDKTSGMNKVEFYIDKELRGTIKGSGPIYQWTCNRFPFQSLKVRGIILRPEITDDYVKFFAIFVIILGVENYYVPQSAYAYDNAGNKDYDEIAQHSSVSTIDPGFYLFKNFIMPNNYSGFIGKFFIYARFYEFL